MWGFEKDTQERWAWQENVFSPQECKLIIDTYKQNLVEATLYNNASTDHFDQARVDQSYRDSRTHFIVPSAETAWIFERMTALTKEMNERYWQYDLFGFGEGLQFTEYTAPGGKYDLHTDKVYNGVIRKLSVVIQLSDPTTFEGGDFHYKDSSSHDVLPKAQGMAMAFPSYALHGVTPVTKGIRYSLVGWVTGPNLK